MTHVNPNPFSGRGSRRELRVDQRMAVQSGSHMGKVILASFSTCRLSRYPFPELAPLFSQYQLRRSLEFWIKKTGVFVRRLTEIRPF